ncbi:MAG TPA: hypothetical protein VHB25_14880, partial [Gemmatimonadaceae bacterium]|nr:hypothetical protein [Gemmatimonadaceae bacterium]
MIPSESERTGQGDAAETAGNAVAPARRALHLGIILAVLEAAAYAIGRMAPAMAALMRPIYVLLLLLFAYPIWHATRHRTG